ncbi:MAG: SDR family NAD(P)-dependent oxidoreductase, partial [Bifidobacteriaceae bacterium]|nr:SDR family NAD(P)-dependent oxidoreductase [Bifidobacteriaceae bacterium]
MPRHVFITGASRGIGQAIARAFFDLGDHVSAIDRQGRGPGIDGQRIKAIAADIAETDQVDRAFDQAEAEFGKVEVLVANAGVVEDRLLIRMSDQDFAKVVDTN